MVVGSAGIAAHYRWGDRRLLVIGNTSHGHRLIEAACNACHRGTGETPSQLCRDCHTHDLADDIHPASLFENQERWGATIAKLDARECVTCHSEHRVAPLGFTEDHNICTVCHPTITIDTPSHVGLRSDSCFTCHNYHYESSIEEVSIEEHLADSNLLETRLQKPAPAARPTAAVAHDAPAWLRDAAIEAAWRQSAHARAEVNCSACHTLDGRAVWIRDPYESSCRRCHRSEVDTFYQGQHGVRSMLDLGALAPADSLVMLPMEATARDAHGCDACHGVHELDTPRAPVEACLSCHADEHSRNYLASPHGVAYVNGRPDTATCATCHLPAREIEEGGEMRTVTWHNNSFTMRPAERMLGEVCMRCHGLAYSWSLVRDPRSIRENFAKPLADIDPWVRKYVDMVRVTLELPSDEPAPPPAESDAQ